MTRTQGDSFLVPYGIRSAHRTAGSCRARSVLRDAVQNHMLGPLNITVVKQRPLVYIDATHIISSYGDEKVER